MPADILIEFDISKKNIDLYRKALPMFSDRHIDKQLEYVRGTRATIDLKSEPRYK